MKRLNVICWIVLTLAVLNFTCGCSIVLPSHANLIDQHAGNAKAIAAKAQADPALPDYAKRWFKAEAESWTYMSDWAHGRKPQPASQPAK